jgi:hypothetical protein
MSATVAPSILDYLSGLKSADANLKDTWRPDDPRYVADVHRQTMMHLSWAYFVLFHADGDHPDWAPLWNPVYLCQPNPDDIYLFTPIRGDRRYRVSGNRGTCRKLIFVSQHGFTGLVDELNEMWGFETLDEPDYKAGPNGEFEIIFSAERPAGHTGNWGKLAPDADILYVRYRMVDWEKEVDPQLSIECLDPVPPKPRLTQEQITQRLDIMARLPGRMTKFFFDMQNQVKKNVGVNVFEPVRYAGLGPRQVYLPAVYELAKGEALIVETEMPEVRPYWNFQIDDPYFNACEYVYRFASLNEWDSKISSDGKLRIVVSLDDPGVPNWLDPGGFTEGTIYGRWYDCSTEPTPTIKRVPFAKLREHLPPDTPTVTPEERAADAAPARASRPAPAALVDDDRVRPSRRRCARVEADQTCHARVETRCDQLPAPRRPARRRADRRYGHRRGFGDHGPEARARRPLRRPALGRPGRRPCGAARPRDLSCAQSEAAAR